MNMIKNADVIDLEYGDLFIYEGTVQGLSYTRGDELEVLQVPVLINWDLPLDATLSELTDAFKLTHPELFI